MGKKTYSSSELQILSELINNMNGGRTKQAIESGITKNDERHRIWTEITSNFNIATGNQLTSEQVRKKYHRIKADERKRNDREAVDRNVRRICGLTGGGAVPEIPPDEDGDMAGLSVDQEPVPNEFGVFHGANASRAIMPISENVANLLPQRPRSQPRVVASHENSWIPESLQSAVQSIFSTSSESSGSSTNRDERNRTQVFSNASQASGSNPTSSERNRPQLNDSDESGDRNGPRVVERSQPVENSSQENSLDYENDAANTDNRIILMHTQGSVVTRTDVVSPVSRANVESSTPKRRVVKGKGASKKNLKSQQQTTNGKTDAAAKYYKKTLKQRTSIHKLQANYLYMKGVAMENYLSKNEISYDLPFPFLNINMESDTESESDEETQG